MFCETSLQWPSVCFERGVRPEIEDENDAAAVPLVIHVADRSCSARIADHRLQCLGRGRDRRQC
jgi:hypothetical protein